MKRPWTQTVARAAVLLAVVTLVGWGAWSLMTFYGYEPTDADVSLFTVIGGLLFALLLFLFWRKL